MTNHWDGPGLDAWQPWTPTEVRALPASDPPGADRHQTWMLDEEANAWRLDIMLEPGDAQTWVFRRDERITAPRVQIVGVRDGVPYLQPEAVLLYKTKRPRAKDEADFRACLPHLAPEQRAWWAQTLRLVHPDHSWVTRVMSDADD